jgi:hypothetical protein
MTHAKLMRSWTTAFSVVSAVVATGNAPTMAESIQFDFGTVGGSYGGNASPAHAVGALAGTDASWNAIDTISGAAMPQETMPGGSIVQSLVYANGVAAPAIDTDFGAYFTKAGAVMDWNLNEGFLQQFNQPAANAGSVYDTALGEDYIYNPHLGSGGSVAFRARGFSAGTYDVFALTTVPDRTSNIRIGVNMDKLTDDTPESVGPIGAADANWTQGANYGRQSVTVSGPNDWITIFSTYAAGTTGHSVLSGVQITNPSAPPAAPPTTVFTPNSTRTENFNSAATSEFVEINSPHRDGQNFGFSNTNNAGGAATGEAGGTFARTVSGDLYADNDLTNGSSGDFDRTKTLKLSGKFSLTSATTPEQILFIGYTNDSMSAGDKQFIGLAIAETNFPTLFRGQLMIRTADGLSAYVPAAQLAINVGTDYFFDFTYTGNPDGSGTLAGTLTDLSTNTVFPKSVSAPPSLDRFDTFGIGAAFASYDSDTNLVNAYFDDLTYSTFVPEPSSLLFSVGALAALAGRGRRARPRRHVN